MKRVLVFGVFDSLHPGHDYFLREAKKLGDELVVCLARDAVVAELKGAPPKHPQMERREMVAEHPDVDTVVYGDEELGTYHVLETISPDLIAIGYDQQALKQDLQRVISKDVPQHDIDAFHPEKYKSSILNT